MDVVRCKRLWKVRVNNRVAVGSANRTVAVGVREADRCLCSYAPGMGAGKARAIGPSQNLVDDGGQKPERAARYRCMTGRFNSHQESVRRSCPARAGGGPAHWPRTPAPVRVCRRPAARRNPPRRARASTKHLRSACAGHDAPYLLERERHQFDSRMPTGQRTAQLAGQQLRIRARDNE